MRKSLLLTNRVKIPLTMPGVSSIYVFILYALIFILFEVELVFLFPWAIVFADDDLITATKVYGGWFSLIETGIFIFILLVGLAYVWMNGMLSWLSVGPYF